MSSLRGRVMAISGGASGLGFATAKLLASKGAKISLADVQAEALDKAVEECGSLGAETIAIVTNVRDHRQVDRWIVATVKKSGRPDGAANLAGVIGKSIGTHTIADLEDDEWDFIMAVNLTGVMYCLRAQMREMRKTRAEGRSIVNAASVAGLMGRPKNAAYGASKHGVIGLTRSAAKEVGMKGVRVNAIAPGTVETPMLAQARSLAGPNSTMVTSHPDHCALNGLGHPGEIAQLVAFLVGEESSYITGRVYSIDGGWYG